jgi:hypothetical protein
MYRLSLMSWPHGSESSAKAQCSSLGVGPCRSAPACVGSLFGSPGIWLASLMASVFVEDVHRTLSEVAEPGRGTAAGAVASAGVKSATCFSHG